MEPAPLPPPFTLRARLASFGFAFRGVWTLFRREHNAWIHLAATVAVGVASWWWSISRLEWALVVLSVAIVLAAEAFNSALETLANSARPQPDPLVGRAKDLAAAAVLLASIGAAIVGLLVFGPHLWAAVVHSSPSK